MNKAPTTNNGNNILSPLVVNLQLEPVWPIKHLHSVYNLENYKGDGIPVQK